jgi:hypothetical protein
MSVLDATRQRSAFTDALRPPPGHILGACLGTTYSLDFEAFTAVILAFVGADIEDPLSDSPSVLTTVARMRSRLRVFVNSGSLHQPGATNRLFALYDHRGGSVSSEGLGAQVRPDRAPRASRNRTHLSGTDCEP